MLRYAELVRSGGQEQERLALLEQHREHVRQALRQQQECLELLDHKIATYESCVLAESRVLAANPGTRQE
jgi:hypothetical protein